jgi:hypothetical protein
VKLSLSKPTGFVLGSEAHGDKPTIGEPPVDAFLFGITVTQKYRLARMTSSMSRVVSGSIPLQVMWPKTGMRTII